MYILGQPVTKFDTYFARLLSPLNRAMASTLIGASVAHTLGPRSGVNGNNGATIAPIISTGF